MHHPVISFLGAGNMGGALISGLIKNGHPANCIWAQDPNDSRLAELAANGIQTTTDQQQAVMAADIVMLAVKPQIMHEICQTLAAAITVKQPLIISIAAGITTQALSRWLGHKARIIRAMPNTPALINQGATAIYANKTCSDQDIEFAKNIFNNVGICLSVEKEEALDAVTALSGSGPAYFFLMLEAMEKAAIQLGLEPEVAHLLAIQTGLGACTMANTSTTPLNKLRENVTSPGGTTQHALDSLTNNNFTAIIAKALTAAHDRSKELAEQFGDAK